MSRLPDRVLIPSLPPRIYSQHQGNVFRMRLFHQYPVAPAPEMTPKLSSPRFLALQISTGIHPFFPTSLILPLQLPKQGSYRGSASLPQAPARALPQPMLLPASTPFWESAADIILSQLHAVGIPPRFFFSYSTKWSEPPKFQTRLF